MTIATATADNSSIASPVTQKHEQLMNVLSSLVDLNSHANHVAQALGVPAPIDTPSDVKQDIPATDSLVGVLNMFPAATELEINKLSNTLAAIALALR